MRCTLLVGASLLLLLSCAPSTRDTRTNPFPKDAEAFNRRVRLPAGVYSLEQTRCWGGGIGGCSPSGKSTQKIQGRRNWIPRRMADR